MSQVICERCHALKHAYEMTQDDRALLGYIPICQTCSERGATDVEAINPDVHPYAILTHILKVLVDAVELPRLTRRRLKRALVLIPMPDGFLRVNATDKPIPSPEEDGSHDSRRKAAAALVKTMAVEPADETGALNDDALRDRIKSDMARAASLASQALAKPEPEPEPEPAPEPATPSAYTIGQPVQPARSLASMVAQHRPDLLPVTAAQPAATPAATPNSAQAAPSGPLASTPLAMDVDGKPVVDAAQAVPKSADDDLSGF